MPAFFGGVLFEFDNLINLLEIFILFCLTASSVYIINDIRDCELDKLHPVKKERPLPSGKVSKRIAFLALLIIYAVIISLSIFFSLKKEVLIIIAIYIVNNLLYSIYLKKIPIIELLIVAIGFVLRVVLGAFAVGILASKWIIIVSFFIAFYLIVTKRRGELINNNGASRKVLGSYNLEFLNAIMYISLSSSLISYLMYSVEINLSERFQTDLIYITTIFIFLILLRHLQQTLVYNKTESPISYFYSDSINLIAILGFLITFYFLIY